MKVMHIDSMKLLVRKCGPALAGIAVLSLVSAALVSNVPAAGLNKTAIIEEAIRLGEEFGIVVGEVDEETRDYLGMQRAEGVVVYEVIAGKPADLAGIRVKAVIKEIDKREIRNLVDFGEALKQAMKEDNFTVATYQPFDPVNPSVAGGLNFHFVRTAQN